MIDALFLGREDAPLQQRNLLHQRADLALQLLDATRRESRFLSRCIALFNRLLEGEAERSILAQRTLEFALCKHHQRIASRDR